MAATYQQWVESIGVPIHKGYFNDDLKTVETGWWEERGCNAAFIQMIGQEGVGETRITGIPPGKTTLPWKFAMDDIFYVLEGKGLTTVWESEQSTRKTFEWQQHSLFVIPRQSFCQLSNTQGDKPATLVSYNHLPLALRAVPDPEFFFNNPYVSSQGDMLEDFYSEAKEHPEEIWPGVDYVWRGNLFPDMSAWDKLMPFRYRGAGGKVVFVNFPNSSPSLAHMAVFPAQTYKKAHYHHPGVLIVITAGEGYSVMWAEGKEEERIFIPWHEGSCFAPQMFHQNFKLGSTPARYLAFHISTDPPGSDKHEDRGTDIEYADESPWVRQTFEKELAKRGLTSLMDEGVYKG